MIYIYGGQTHAITDNILMERSLANSERIDCCGMGR